MLGSVLYDYSKYVHVCPTVINNIVHVGIYIVLCRLQYFVCDTTLMTMTGSINEWSKIHQPLSETEASEGTYLRDIKPVLFLYLYTSQNTLVLGPTLQIIDFTSVEINIFTQ